MSENYSDYVLETPKVCQNIETARSIFREKLTPDEQKLYLKLEDEQLKEMYEFFMCYVDENQEEDVPVILTGDIEKIMIVLGENPTPEDLTKMVKEIDFNDDGMVDFDEFTCLMVKQMKHVDDTLEEELETVFKRFDKDGNGVIDAADLQLMM